MKKILLIICMLIMNITAVNAENPKQILILAKELPDMYILQDDGNKQFQVRILDRRTAMPMTCLNQEKARFDELKLNETAITCQIQSINSHMNLRIKHYIRLNLSNIAKDFHIKLKDYDLHKFSSTLQIFQAIGQHLSFKTIANYQHYLKTDLSLSDLYTLFKHYQDGPIQVHYLYPRLIWLPLNKSYYPLDKTFYR